MQQMLPSDDSDGDHDPECDHHVPQPQSPRTEPPAPAPAPRHEAHPLHTGNDDERREGAHPRRRSHPRSAAAAARLLSWEVRLGESDSDDDEYSPRRALGKKKKVRRGGSARRGHAAAGPWRSRRSLPAAAPAPGAPQHGAAPGPSRNADARHSHNGKQRPGQDRELEKKIKAFFKNNFQEVPSRHGAAAASVSQSEASRAAAAPDSGRQPPAPAPPAAPAPAPGTPRLPPRGPSATLTSMHDDKSYRKSLLDWLERGQDSSSSEDGDAGSRLRPRSPPDEFVQLSLTRVYEPMPSSAMLKAVLAHAESAPAQAALLLDCLPEAAATPAQETRVAHAPCRAHEEPMRDYRLQEPEAPPPDGGAAARSALAQLASAERAWRSELARLDAQAAAHARALSDVRAAAGAASPRAPALHAELDELLRRAKHYYETLKDVHTSRAAGEAALQGTVQKVLAVVVAGLERQGSG